jgi:hypothetical protein
VDGDPDSSVWRKSPHVVNLKPMTRGDDARDNVKLYEKWVYSFLLVVHDGGIHPSLRIRIPELPSYVEDLCDTCLCGGLRCKKRAMPYCSSRSRFQNKSAAFTIVVSYKRCVQQIYQQVESGTVNLSLKSLNKLAKAFRVSFLELMQVE